MVKYSQTTEKKGSVEMKGIRAAVLALGGAFLLAGCGGESGVLAPIPAEGFSQGVYDALEENWTAWEAVDELERMLSSTLPGHCAQEFDSWAQCADFLGPSIPDPAADCGWLEEAMKHFQTANRMDPNNMEYTAALNQMMWQRQNARPAGGYRTYTYGGNPGCSSCDLCTSLICADCCCECMGGDLIHCC